MTFIKSGKRNGERFSSSSTRSRVGRGQSRRVTGSESVSWGLPLLSVTVFLLPPTTLLDVRQDLRVVVLPSVFSCVSSPVRVWIR